MSDLGLTDACGGMGPVGGSTSFIDPPDSAIPEILRRHFIAPVCGFCGGEIDKRGDQWFHVSEQQREERRR